jgi:hypothetical protein
MRPRYYCDHCNKGNGSPSAMQRHESGCTKNPQRVCRMCVLINEQQLPLADLLLILDSHSFKSICEAANGCPACILAALRARDAVNEYGGHYVAGPDDGRNEWSFAQAKVQWWAGYNSDRAVPEHY